MSGAAEQPALRVTDQVTDADRSELRDRLLSYNLARLEDRNPRPLGVFAEDAAGRKTAGLTGTTHGNWLTVQYLWVSESFRDQGLGSAILAQAEAEARVRHCRYCFLDTFGFQAPGFYEKHGYRMVFTLEDYPVTGTRHYFVKTL